MQKFVIDAAIVFTVIKRDAITCVCVHEVFLCITTLLSIN